LPFAANIAIKKMFVPIGFCVYSYFGRDEPKFGFFDPQKWNCAFDTLWKKNGVDWTKPHGFMKG
jgi:hypothetical protein